MTSTTSTTPGRCDSVVIDACAHFGFCGGDVRRSCGGVLEQ
jgi:hypothetical protein